MSGPYIHGHHASVVTSHSRGTAQNSAAYLLPQLRPGMDVLDVGCGPGTITVDLATHVPGGRVLGIDTAPQILERAAELAVAQGVENVEFETADVTALPQADASFDVVHAHQVLQHLSDPVAALVEMRRVLRPGGWLAIRDADYGAMRWFPDSVELDRWRDLYLALTGHHNPDAGRALHAWALRAGFVDVQAGASLWCYTAPQDRQWWARSWAERVQHSSFATHALEHGYADAAELAELAAGWTSWAQAEGAWFAVLHGEVLARR
ncbi:MAG: methyltransferase domain-containing protein [Beutenbergiaceae bacterium]